MRRNYLAKFVILTMLFTVSPYSQADGISSHEVHATTNRYAFGIEGGIVNVDWPSVDPHLATITAGAFEGGTIKVSQSKTRSFQGNLGAFVGYLVPCSQHILFAPTVAYRYIPKTYYTTTLTTDNTPVRTVMTKTSSVFNITELTVQTSYLLNNGTNFFVQPGVAIITTSLKCSNDGNSSNISNRSTAFRPEIYCARAQTEVLIVLTT